MSSVFLMEAIWNGIVFGALLAPAAIALTLIYAVAQFPNAATGDFATIGAYVTFASAILLGISTPIAIGVGILATGLVSLICYVIIFQNLNRRYGNLDPRDTRIPKLIVSIGIAFALRGVVIGAFGSKQYTIPVPIMKSFIIGELRILPLDLILVTCACSLTLLVFLILRKTALGRQMRAVAANRELALLSDINAERVMLLTWLIVGSLAGAGGIFIAMKTVILPDLGWALLVPLFTGVILGGVGSPLGALIGMITFGVMVEIASALWGSGYRIPFSFIVLAMLLWLRPQGLLGKKSQE